MNSGYYGAPGMGNSLTVRMGKEEFTESENAQNAEKVKNELVSLKNIISEIVEMKVNTQLVSTSNRTVMLYSLFESEESLARYQIHPEHIRVSKFVGTVLKERVCLDLNNPIP